MKDLSTPHRFFYLYILKSGKDKGLYIGMTSDLKKRLRKHNDGKVSSTQYRKPLSLVYYEAYSSFEDVKIRERRLKQFGNAHNELIKRIAGSLNTI